MMMIKVCFIISGFSYSGAEIVLYRYLEKNKIIDPYFVILYNKPSVINKFIEVYGLEKIHSLNINHSKNLLRFVPWIDINKVKNKVNNIINFINPDIIYCNNTMESMLMSKYISESQIASIAHIHDMKDSIKSIIRRIVTQNRLHQYDKVITVSDATKRQWNEENIEVIYNGLDNSYFKNDNYVKYSSAIKNVGFIGTISKRKGIDIILNKVDTIIDMGLNIHIAYSNIEDDDLYRIILKLKKEYGEKIKLYRDLDSKEIINFYDFIDLLIVPSRQDPLPTVILESSARKTIVLASEVDGIPEMVRNKILLMKKDDFINKLKYICNMNKNNLQILSQEQHVFCKSKFINKTKREKVNNLIINLLK